MFYGQILRYLFIAYIVKHISSRIFSEMLPNKESYINLYYLGLAFDIDFSKRKQVDPKIRHFWGVHSHFGTTTECCIGKQAFIILFFFTLLLFTFFKF